MNVLEFFHGLFARPRCDFTVCDNPKHDRIHIQKGTGTPYVPTNLLVRSVLERAVPLIGLAVNPTPPKYGRVNVNEQPHLATRLRCFVNGFEVTNECFEADDINGYALCYRRKADGSFEFDRRLGEMTVERFDGDVKITPLV